MLNTYAVYTNSVGDIATFVDNYLIYSKCDKEATVLIDFNKDRSKSKEAYLEEYLSNGFVKQSLDSDSKVYKHNGENITDKMGDWYDKYKKIGKLAESSEFQKPLTVTEALSRGQNLLLVSSDINEVENARSIVKVSIVSDEDTSVKPLIINNKSLRSLLNCSVSINSQCNLVQALLVAQSAGFILSFRTPEKHQINRITDDLITLLIGSVESETYNNRRENNFPVQALEAEQSTRKMFQQNVKSGDLTIADEIVHTKDAYSTLTEWNSEADDILLSGARDIKLPDNTEDEILSVIPNSIKASSDNNLVALIKYAKQFPNLFEELKEKY